MVEVLLGVNRRIGGNDCQCRGRKTIGAEEICVCGDIECFGIVVPVFEGC